LLALGTGKPVKTGEGFIVLTDLKIFMSKKFWFSWTVTVWAAFLVFLGLFYYVNWYMPHGPSYPTGDYDCMFDGEGPCGEIYKEDLSVVDIPNWAKFLRANGIFFFTGLPILGLILIAKIKKTEE